MKACFGSSAADEVIIEAFENTKALYTRDGIVTPGSVEKAGAFMMETGAIKAPATFEQVADNTFLPKR